VRLEALWEPWHGHGIEHLRLSVELDGVMAESQVRDREAGFEFRYVVRADPAWRTRAVEVIRVDAHRALQLRTDGDGHWDGHPELDGCLDVDLRCSPFTNTLPIRRQPQGGAVRAAWVGLDLEVEPLEQGYSPLGERRWHYRAGDFERELEVDEHGLVLDYPGGWRRVRERA
jgi:hypothetical protein